MEGPVDQLAALIRELVAGRMNPVVPPPGTDAAVVVSAPSLPWDEAVAAWRDWATAAGVKPGTLKAYGYMLTRVSAGAGWRSLDECRAQHVSAFLASRMRNEHKGRPWSANTVRQAIHAFHSLGEWMASTGAPDPFAGLELPGKTEGPQKQSLTPESARLFLAKSHERGSRDKRSNPHAALFWCWLLYTGFRHEEGANVLWGDVDLSGPTPGIVLRPELEGNKATRREWQPIHPSLSSLLQAHRATVPHRAIDRVFPATPGDNSFEIARMAAGLPKKWADGSPLTIHSLRVTFSTWLDQTGCPQGLRELLVRHRNGGITTSRYRPASMEERWAAVAKLPWVWPYNPPSPPVTPPDPPSSPPESPKRGRLGENISFAGEVSCTPTPNSYSVGASRLPHDISPTALAAEQAPPDDLHSLGGRPPRDPQSDGVPVSSEGLSPVPTPDHLSPEVIRVLAKWIALELSRAPRKGVQPDDRFPVPHRPPSGFPTI